jgi:hypothetical protein
MDAAMSIHCLPEEIGKRRRVNRIDVMRAILNQPERTLDPFQRFVMYITDNILIIGVII